MKKRSGSKFIANDDCGCGETRLLPYGDSVLVSCPCLPPRTLDLEGNYKFIQINWEYKAGDV